MCMNCMKFGTFKFWVYQITVNLFSKQVASVRPQSKAKFFLKLLKSKVITFAHFLIDVLTVNSSMSMALQKRGTCVYEVHRQLELTVTNLQKLESRYFEKM